MHYLRVTYKDGTASDELCSVSTASNGKLILSPSDSAAELLIADADAVSAIKLIEMGVAKKVAE